MIAGIIGVKEELIEDSREFVQFTKDSNINMWMLTSNSEESTLNVAHNLNILENKETLNILKKQQILHVNEKSRDQILAQIRLNLYRIKELVMPSEEIDFYQIRKSMQNNLKKQEMQEQLGRKSLQAEGSQADSVSRKSKRDSNIVQELNKKMMRSHTQLGKTEIRQKEFNIALILCGESFGIIENDQYLLNHLLLIMSFCQNIVGYQLNPRQKGFIVN